MRRYKTKILLCLLLISIAFNIGQFMIALPPKMEGSYDGLDSWQGVYLYNEFIPPNIDLNCRIEIYKVESKHFAKIVMWGYQTDEEIIAKVFGNESRVVFLYDELLNNEPHYYQNNDILLSFERSLENELLQTHWAKISCVQNNRYFEKIYSNYFGTWKICDIYHPEIASKPLFEINDELRIDSERVSYKNSSIEISSESRTVVFPEFLNETNDKIAVTPLAKDFLYNGLYTEIELKDAREDIVFKLFLINDKDVLIMDPTGFAYRAVLMEK